MLAALRRLHVLTLLAALIVVGSAHAGPPGKWTQATDPVLANIDQLGLARTPDDGILHIVWPKNVPGSGEIWHTRISSGGIVGARNPASWGWAVVGADPDLLVMPDGRLRLFFPGLGTTNEEAGAQSVDGDASGSNWSPRGPRISNGLNVLTIGATLRSDGAPIFALGGPGGVYHHTGLSLADPDISFQGTPSNLCCLYNPELATDESSGETSVAYFSLRPGEAGVFVQTLAGPPQLVGHAMTGGNFLAPDSRMPLVSRAGGGVYLAYCKGYPTCKEAWLLKVLSGASPLRVGRGQTIEDVYASRAPDGRIWVLWWDSSKDRIYAIRTNKAATRPGPVTSLTIPNGAGHVWKLFGEGSAGPLDLFASVDTSGKIAYWHQQVLPVLSLKCASRAGALSCQVTDAGDSVAGAKVSAGGKSATASGSGRVSIVLPPGTYRASASKAGFAAAAARFKVK